MGSDKFDEGYLAPEVESGDQAIIPSCDLEPDALAIQYLGSGSRFLDFISRGPVCGSNSNELVPAFERRSGLGVIPQNPRSVFRAITRTLLYSLFPRLGGNNRLRIGRIPADQPWTEPRAEIVMVPATCRFRTPMNMAEWLRTLGLKRYEQAFRENRIESPNPAQSGLSAGRGPHPAA
jgi:SAM (Sterile alpha motif) domain-containing protein